MSKLLRPQPCPQPRTAPRSERWAWFLLAVCASDDECRVWPYATNATDGSGYPRIGEHYLHQLSCEYRHGPRPPGFTASHLCGVKRCVSPAHIVWESLADNLARTPHAVRRGEDHPAAKLSTKQVIAMRARWAAGGITQRALAAEYGVHQTTCGDIVCGREWRWLS